MVSIDEIKSIWCKYVENVDCNIDVNMFVQINNDLDDLFDIDDELSVEGYNNNY